MNRPLLVILCRRYGAVCLLLAIAGHQIHQARAHNLTPWKGGGFGMFSTVESGGSRIVRTFLVAVGDDGLERRLAVDLPPEMSPVLLLLRQAPEQLQADGVATMMASRPWAQSELVDLDREDALALLTRTPEDPEHARELARLTSQPRAWMPGLASSEAFGAGKPIRFDYAEVEVWQMTYDPKARALASKLRLHGSSRVSQVSR
jgi:hypothetical protein